MRETDSTIFHGKDGEDVECTRCFSDCVVLLDEKEERIWLAGAPSILRRQPFRRKGSGAKTFLLLLLRFLASPDLAESQASSFFRLRLPPPLPPPPFFPSPHLKGQEEREREASGGT